MSLGTAKTKTAYQKALPQGQQFDFERMTIIQDWDHWVLVENEFPYDKIAKTHHLLVPWRAVRAPHELTELESAELEKILDQLAPNYDARLTNFPRHTSVGSRIHIHLLEYK